MASLIEGYNYDVFISYRQKDNKYDGWVTGFVENLRLELEATFKEDISVYFDKNPFDGILEVNDVSESLRDKLKSVIFIPVLSQTYCDPRSYAFHNEFMAFVTQSSNDKIGLKVRLANGNVSSRVLPVKINELSSEDINLVESITGGPLRGVDFIYRSPGVNRPLRQTEDHPQNNLNKTVYRDQINKVAQSIKDILTSIDGSGNNKAPVRKNDNKKPEYASRKLLLPGILTLLIAAASLFYFMVLNRNGNYNHEVLNRSVSYYDFYNNWDKFEGNLHMVTLFSTGLFSEEIIEIRPSDNYYKCTTITAGEDTIIKGIISGKSYRQVNGNKNPDSSMVKAYGLDSLRIDDFKQHHYWHFGGIIFLKNSGMALDKKVVRATFSGQKCIVLTFTQDSSENSANYFRNSTWKVYINPDNYSVLGYRMKGGFYSNDHMVVCQEELNYNLLRIPMYKFYYNNTNNLMLVDLFHIDAGESK